MSTKGELIYQLIRWLNRHQDRFADILHDLWLDPVYFATGGEEYSPEAMKRRIFRGKERP